jgi:hypothetical protein
VALAQGRRVSAVARLVTGDRVDTVWTWCPGCDSLHPFRIRTVDGALPTWEWDGNLEAPTFSPSLLCHSSVHLCEGEHDPVVCKDPDGCSETTHSIGHVVDGQLLWRFRDGIPEGAGPAVYGHGQPHTREPAWGSCHSFLRAGRWEFLSDSAHQLAGQTVDMVPLPDGWAE